MHPLEFPAIKVNAETIRLHSLMQRARMRGQAQFVDEAINAALVLEAAREMGISVSRDDAQQAANEFRAKHSLLKAQDAIRWLEDRGMTVTDWQNALEEDVLIAKFKQARFGSKVDVHFAEHKLQFDHSTIGRIATTNENLASELLLQIREEGAVFEDIARKFSSDLNTRETGGYVGKVRRKDLGPAASSAVFGGKPGSVHGPFKVGKEFHVLRVIELHPAELDSETRKEVLDRLFNDWLADMRAKSNIEIPLYDSIPAVVEAR
jgi:parvulin-like peptidyl-prolyl isomerase